MEKKKIPQKVPTSRLTSPFLLEAAAGISPRARSALGDPVWKTTGLWEDFSHPFFCWNAGSLGYMQSPGKSDLEGTLKAICPNWISLSTRKWGLQSRWVRQNETMSPRQTELSFPAPRPPTIPLPSHWECAEASLTSSTPARTLKRANDSTQKERDLEPGHFLPQSGSLNFGMEKKKKSNGFIWKGFADLQ